MSSQHSGNLLNQITFEEHDGNLNAKKVSLVSGATIYAVVNTSSGGNVTVQQGTTPWITSQQGNVTLDVGSLVGIRGNLTLSDPKGYIGLVTIDIGTNNQVAIKGNITLSGTANVAVLGNVTIDSIANPVALKGNLTLSDPKGFIGLVTVVQSSTSRSIVGNVTIDSIANPIALKGNLTLSDSKAFIGLTTAVNGQSWPDPKTYIGLVTIDIGTNNSVAIKGNVTLSGTANVAVLGNLTLTDSKGFIGLTTAVNGQAWPDPKTFIGLVTIGNIPTVALSQSGTDNDIQVVGNVTLSDAKTFIGLVTSFNSYGSNSTILTGVISATGFTTIAAPPNNTRFFIKNAHISSLGRSEVEIRSGATAIIPFTSLSTTSGFAAHYGELGLPFRAQNDNLVINLNGLATIAYMFNVRSEA